MAGVPYTPHELALLPQHYPGTSPQQVMALLPGRSWRAIRCMARRLGLEGRRAGGPSHRGPLPKVERPPKVVKPKALAKPILKPVPKRALAMNSANNPATTPNAYAQAENRKRSDAAKKADVLYTADEMRNIGKTAEGRASWQYQAYWRGGDPEVRAELARRSLPPCGG